MGIWWVLRIRSVIVVLVGFGEFPWIFRVYSWVLRFWCFSTGFHSFCCFTVFVGFSTRSKIDISFLENTY